MSFLQKILMMVAALLNALHSYELDCPSCLQRKIRRNAKCNTSDGYMCLFDENDRQNIELCRSKPEFEQPGYKFINVGNLQGETCGNNRYQPFKFWTNGSSECVYKTSKCNDVGQIMYGKGTNILDISCRCDYSNGFDFVFKPRNPCFCLPQTEDCTCYVKSCFVGEILTPDYDCVVSSTWWNSSFKCKLKDQGEIKEDQIQIITSITDESDAISSGRIYVLLVIIFGVAFIGMLIFVLIAHWPQRLSITLEDPWFNTEIIKNILNKETVNLKEKTEKFVHTLATRTILEGLQNNNCVLISGPPGVGKTANAYGAALSLEKTYQCKVITVAASDLQNYVLSTIDQVFIIDDVFGKYCCDLDFQFICSSIRSVLTDHTKTKIIMTCRSQIHHLIQDQLAIEKLSFVHCDLLFHSLQLSVDERKEIGKSYFANGVIGELNDSVLMLYSFFPSLCTIFAAGKEKDNFFAYPTNYIAYEVNNIKQKSTETYLALALLVVLDNRVEENVLDEQNNKTNGMLNDVYTDSGVLNAPSKGLLLSTLISLDGTFTKKCKNSFTFMHKNMFDMMVGCIGHHFIRSILKHGSFEFVMQRIQLACVKEHIDSFTIHINPDYYNDYFVRLTSDINRGDVSTVFANKQMCSDKFRKEMLPYLKKYLKAKDIVDGCDKSTVIHKVSSSGYIDLLTYFVKHDMPNINKQDINGKTALHLAVFHKQHDIVAILLRCYADVHTIDSSGQSVIHTACKIGDLHMIELLLKHKACINKKDQHGLTPLHLASDRGDIEVVKLLTQNKANMNEIDDIGRTPLYVACEMNRADTVTFLLQHKPENTIHIEEKNKRYTPLHVACTREHTTIVETLLQYGAYVNRAAFDNTTPLKLANKTGNEKLINLLKNHKETCSAPK